MKCTRSKQKVLSVAGRVDGGATESLTVLQGESSSFVKVGDEVILDFITADVLNDNSPKFNTSGCLTGLYLEHSFDNETKQLRLDSLECPEFWMVINLASIV